MAITVTLLDVREFCPTLGASDASIELFIQAIGCRLDTCLEAAYVDCADFARLIKINTICHFSTVTSKPGQTTSRKYANGAAETYKNYVEGGQGLNATRFGEAILLLDTAGCVNKAFPAKARQFITTAGTSGSQDDAFFGTGLFQ